MVLFGGEGGEQWSLAIPESGVVFELSIHRASELAADALADHHGVPGWRTLPLDSPAVWPFVYDLARSHCSIMSAHTGETVRGEPVAVTFGGRPAGECLDLLLDRLPGFGDELAQCCRIGVT